MNIGPHPRGQPLSPRQALFSARHCRASDEAFPLCWEGDDEGLSPLREGSLQEKASPLAGRKWHAREGSGLVPMNKTSGRVASRSFQDLCVTPRERAWGTRGGSPLRRTCRRHHYHARRSNDGLDHLVKTHRRSAPDGARRQLGA
jgi:hypothetical protein